jgi:uncharacterized membrane protein
MKHRIAPLEAISWTVLLLAALLFGTAVAYAGDPKPKKKNSSDREGKAIISIRKEENGKVIKLDTTLDVADEEAVKAVLRNLDPDGDFHFDLRMPDEEGKEDAFTMKLRSEDLSPEERKRIREELEEPLRESEKSMDEARKALREFHLEIQGNDDDAAAAFSFRFPAESDRCLPKNFRFDLPGLPDDDEELDSLRGDDRILIIGKPDETPPVLEKTVNTSSGKQVFVYKRQLSPEAQRSAAAAHPLDIQDIEVYPNPADDRLTLSFRKQTAGDLNIHLTDLSGKVAYDETLRAFSGAYYKRIDLSGIAVGTYTLSLEQGDARMTRKVIVR